MLRGLAIGLAALASAAPVWARDPVLAIPIDCDLETDCFIQQYVDADPGDGAADFTCGSLSYDSHKGTDFALPSLSAMEDGVDVLAAAPGTVRGVRDGMSDTLAGRSDAPDISGRECGNGVVISHGDGWETQYCHLREGSVGVTEGQRVAAGTTLGQVGLSGQTTFPHLHLSVRQDGRVVDPFNPDGLVTCGEVDDETLWSDAPEYVPGGLIAAGFSPDVPGYDDVKVGHADTESLPPDADALVIWAYAFGVRQGDMMRLSITGPEGEVIAEDVGLDRTQAQLFRAIGKRMPDAGWPSGTYAGEALMIRGDETLDRISAQVTIR